MTNIAPTQFKVGDLVSDRTLVTIHGEPVQIPDQERLVHLQFRRYSGCPVCNVHLRAFSKRHDEIEAAGIREVVLFHSQAETMRELQGGLPFAVIADPKRKLYAEFGVGKMSALAALDPRSWRAAARALTAAESLHGAAGLGEKHTGAPADLLIDTNGRVRAAKYGKRVDDHWSVDELLYMVPALVEASRS